MSFSVRDGFPGLARRVLSGYRRVFGRLAVALAAVTVLLAASFIVVFPLWLFATRAPGTYTTVMTAILAVTLLAVPIRRIRRNWSRARVLPILKQGAFIAAVGGLLYFSGMLYAAAYPLAAGLMLFAAVVLVGYRASAGSRRSGEG